jgi:integrase/recombinase XerC
MSPPCEGESAELARVGGLPTRVPAASARILVQSFLRGRRPTTLKAYRQDLEDLRRFLGQDSLEDAVQQLLGRGRGEAHLVALAWLANMQERELAPATASRRLAAARSLVRLARMLEVVDWELEVRGPKVRSLRDTRGPGREAVEKIAQLLDRIPGHRAARNKAIVRVLFDLALRRQEAVTLDLEHVDLEGQRLWVLGKGRDQREPVTLPEPTQDALQEWLALRGLAPGPLFTSMNPSGVGDGRLVGRSIGRILGELGDRAGVGHVRPHGLRHAAITEALEATGGDVRAVQRFSRHADLNMVLAYDDDRRDLAGEVARKVAERVQPSQSMRDHLPGHEHPIDRAEPRSGCPGSGEPKPAA